MTLDIGESIRLIEKLRRCLEELVASRGTFSDGEVLAASRDLDEAIAYYLSICQD